jgi:hypothetical protein
MISKNKSGPQGIAFKLTSSKGDFESVISIISLYKQETPLESKILPLIAPEERPVYSKSSKPFPGSVGAPCIKVVSLIDPLSILYVLTESPA